MALKGLKTEYAQGEAFFMGYQIGSVRQSITDSLCITNGEYKEIS